MAEEQLDAPEVLETPEVDAETTPETPIDEPDTVELTKAELDELKQKASKADELDSKNKQLFERLKKGDKKEAPESKDLSSKDIIYFAKADIHPDDVDEVIELARLKNWDMKQAHDYLKPLLDTRMAERRTAAATQTRGARGTSKTSGEELLARAERTGQMPDSEDGMAALYSARQAKRLGK